MQIDPVCSPHIAQCTPQVSPTREVAEQFAAMFLEQSLRYSQPEPKNYMDDVNRLMSNRLLAESISKSPSNAFVGAIEKELEKKSGIQPR